MATKTQSRTFLDELDALAPGKRKTILEGNEHIAQKYYSEKGRGDFWFFLTNVLRNPVLEETLHKPLARWLQVWNKQKKLCMLPRGHIKSNVNTIAYSLWEAVRNPNIRVLIGSHKDKDAIKFLRTIRLIIEKHKRFQYLYPEICPMMNGKIKVAWNARELRIERTSESDLVENTFEVTSVAAAITGRHYDFFVPDDLVTKENVKNPDQILRTKDFHELCESLLDPGGRELMSGTRYAFDDEYGRVMDTPEIADEYDLFKQPWYKGDVRPSIFDQRLSGEPWNRDMDFDHLIFPSRFTLDDRDFVSPDGDATKNRKSLIALRRLQGSTTFANQYDLQPFDPDSAMFKESDILIVDRLPNYPLRWFRVCDLSSDTTKTNSFTVIITGAMDPFGNIYVVDIWWGNYSPSRIRDELIRGQRVEEFVRPIMVGMEQGPYERAIKTDLLREASKAEVHIPIRYLPSNQAAKPKDERIWGLQSWVEGHHIRILKSCKNKDIMIEEFVKHPKFVRKDTIDALAQVPFLVISPRQAKPVEVQEVASGETFDQALAKLIRGNERGRYIGNDRVARRPIRFARL